MAVALCSVTWLSGCGGGAGTDAAPPVVNLGGTQQANANNVVGNAACLQCHFAFPSNYFLSGDAFDARSYADAGDGIGANYQKGVHNNAAATDPTPQCETCHGPGGGHFGTGPIPRWSPNYQQCGQCHTGQNGQWLATAHANPDAKPDKFFFQGGYGTDQAKGPTGQGLFMADGKTPVTKTQHIEECSACHAYAQSERPRHIPTGDIIDTPVVGCPSCHDSHSPALRDRPMLPTRPNGTPANLMLRLKPVRVNNNPAGAQFGANNSTGTWIRPGLTFPFNMTTVANDPAFTTQNNTVGDLMRLSSDRLCASCHSKGKWRYTAFDGTTPSTNTHNDDIYGQYLTSGHANKTDAPYAEFSLLAALGGTHRPQFPIDMGKTDGRVKGGINNYDCYQCHNGIGTIDYLAGTQGGLDFGDSQDAHIIFGDSTTTCISCHDPHDNGGQGLGQKNVRIPKYLSYNKFFNDVNNPGKGNKRGGFNGMLDGTAIPAAAVGKPSLLCLFCHQGRESGYTLYRNALTKNFNFYTAAPAATVNVSYTNAHYFSGAAQLWSKNSWEFNFNGTPQTYSNGVPEHQTKNCTGCHMAATNDTVEGGHTFRPKVETCRECHAGIPDVLSVISPVDVDGDPTTTTVFQSFGTINTTTAPAANKTGLFNILGFALYQQGIEYDPDAYPYFFKKKLPYSKANHTSANGFTVWTAGQLQAAFNLGQIYKSGNAAYVHNYYYSAQILIDSCRAVGVTTNPNTGLPFVRPTTPTGGTTRPATDYRNITVP